MLRLAPLVVLIFTTPAAADVDQPVAAYHTEAVATDGAAAVVLVAGISLLGDSGLSTTGKWAAGIAAYGTYALALPILHARKGRWGSAAASFGLRALLPVTAMVLAGKISDQSCPYVSDPCNAQIDRYQITGILVGLALPVLLDDVLLSRGDDPPTLLPTVQAAPGAMSFGVAGRF